MKTITSEWLNHAWKDIDAAKRLVEVKHLTGIAAFHSQQAVEKSLKAIIEEYELGLRKTHDVESLYAIIGDRLSLDEEILEQLNTVYLDARYPAALGLMPGGLPAIEDAKRLLHFAEQTYNSAKTILENAE